MGRPDEGGANAIKHSNASAISVTVTRDSSCLRSSIADDGIGGADPEAGSGLRSLRDRVDAHGILALESKEGRGTTISIELPLTSPLVP